MTANQITAELLLRIPERLPSVRVWRSNRIKAKAVGRGGRMRMVNAGIDGQADITGIARVRYGGLSKMAGVRLELEVKAGRDAQSEVQKNFQKMIEDLGGIYLLARDVDRALEELNRRLASYYPIAYAEN
jgi:hypothetical protein